MRGARECVSVCVCLCICVSMCGKPWLWWGWDWLCERCALKLRAAVAVCRFMLGQAAEGVAGELQESLSVNSLLDAAKVWS